MSAQGMPPQILALFAPRLPLDYLPPLGGTGKRPLYNGLAAFVQCFEATPPPPVPPFESPKERRERKKREKLQEHRKKQDELIAAYDPHNSDCATKNPYATLFVGRLSYETTEKKLKKEFECFGPIRRVKVITDFNGKSRGYAFIEYETEEDLKTAYKQGDGKKIDGRRVLVDVERARTVPGWIPRRLGGGKGPARFAEPKKKARGLQGAGVPPGPPSSSFGSNRGSWQGSGYRGGRGGGGGGYGRRDERGGYGGGRPNDRNFRDGGGTNRYGGGSGGGGRPYNQNQGGGFAGQWDGRDGGNRGPGRDYRRRSRSRDRRHRSRSPMERR